MATKVSHAAIDELRKIGMKEALNRVSRGEGNEEFREAVRRFYPQAKHSGAAEKRSTVTKKMSSYGNTAVGTKASPDASPSVPAPRQAVNGKVAASPPPGKGGVKGLDKVPSKEAITRRIANPRANPKIYPKKKSTTPTNLDKIKAGNFTLRPKGGNVDKVLDFLGTGGKSRAERVAAVKRVRRTKR